MMGTSATGELYSLKGIDESFIKKIIETRAFNVLTERPPKKLLKLIGKIAKRCSGSPLAATALGSLLSTKTTEEEWKAVLNKSPICDDETNILPVLKLSYNGLPSHMRQCFAFCAMFPKGYEIDVETLIQLWMANGFIPEKQRERPEIIGKNIFLELASRSFFQDVNGILFQFNHTKVCRTTCKIHDLMHDVAMDSMGDECATIDTKLSEIEDFPYSARHLFLSVDQAETILNDPLKKGSPTFQTLIFWGKKPGKGFQKLSKYRSVRALKIQQGSFLRPKYLHHLRYLDLSESNIKALPEDISILYHLQTLNLSGCDELERLPKGLKYLTALRHLYTHGCGKLKSMPAKLGRLTSLQVLTCFVAGNNFRCSNVGELQNLDLGGKLELSQLENVAGADAQAAGLVNKEKLAELELRWSDTDQDEQNNHEEVLEGLKPHEDLKVLMIYLCGSSTFPMWMNTLSSMVKLVLFGCKRLKKLPALWQLPALQILHLQGFESLHCLCSGGTTSVLFLKLKVLTLLEMEKFEAWLDSDVVQGKEPIFPNVEELEIRGCGSLTALPKAASVVIAESSGEVDTECRSAFPALRKMILHHLAMFDRWEAVEGILGEEVTFPQLEELSITSCGSLSTLPSGSLLVKQSFDGAKSVCRRSAFPALWKLELSGLSALERWGEAEGIPGREEVTFPLLENLEISICPKLTDLPDAPKLSELSIRGDDPQISLQAASRCIPSLSTMTLDASPRGGLPELCAFDRLARNVPLPAMWLTSCNLLFSSHSSALALWTCFAQLVDLEIWKCDALVYWPENVFQVLVCLRNLVISGCSKLTGHTQASDERCGILPRLESLKIQDCESLVEVPNLPASLETLHIERCGNLKSIVFGQEEDTRLVSGEGVVRPDTSSSIPGSSSSEATTSTAVLELSSAANHRFLPCLESLTIEECNGLSQVANLPPSIKTLVFRSCENLRSLPQVNALQKLSIRCCNRLESLESGLGEVWLLEELELFECRRLVSLPDGPQAYSSLRVLEIKYCGGIKLLPPSLQRRLDFLEEKDLDARYEEPKTLTRAIRRLANKASARLFTCSRDQESESESESDGDSDSDSDSDRTMTRAIRRLVNKASTRLFPCSRDAESDSDSGCHCNHGRS